MRERERKAERKAERERERELIITNPLPSFLPPSPNNTHNAHTFRSKTSSMQDAAL